MGMVSPPVRGRISNRLARARPLPLTKSESAPAPVPRGATASRPIPRMAGARRSHTRLVRLMSDFPPLEDRLVGRSYLSMLPSGKHGVRPHSRSMSGGRSWERRYPLWGMSAPSERDVQALARRIAEAGGEENTPLFRGSWASERLLDWAM